MTVLLTVDGDQVPFIPLVEVVGNIGARLPAHIGGTGLNVGKTLLMTVTVNVVDVAHCPAVGVNV